ncbi:MAG TPA: hypothetical protein VK569_07685 [Bacteroidota bacterium]|nr:hypothetical protein [Bacteroidota bacterium]
MAPFLHSLAVALLGVATAGGSGLDILSSMNVRFIVVDPAGRRTGYDAVTGREVSEIPSSRYGVKFTGVTEEGGGERSRDMVAAFGSPDHLIDGTYSIVVTGEKAGPFWLSISIYREPLSEDFNIRGAIRAGEQRSYHLMYAGDPSVPIRIDTVDSR